MVRSPIVDEDGLRKGAWSREEDTQLRTYVQRYGHWNWRLLPKYAGLARSGKSCRLRWMNYLKPGLKRGNFSQQEQDQIIDLHAKLGNKWSAMALELPGRTDNEIKNFWYGHIAKRNGKRTIRSDDKVIRSSSDVLEALLLEPYEVPNSEANSPSQIGQLFSPDASKLETDGSPDCSVNPEPTTPDFWTQPFEVDKETTYIGEKSGFLTEMRPLETDIYSQAIHFSSFLEEDLMFFNACCSDLASFGYAGNLF